MKHLYFGKEIRRKIGRRRNKSIGANHYTVIYTLQTIE
jgi:hypothetical protein